MFARNITGTMARLIVTDFGYFDCRGFIAGTSLRIASAIGISGATEAFGESIVTL